MSMSTFMHRSSLYVYRPYLVGAHNSDTVVVVVVFETTEEKRTYPVQHIRVHVIISPKEVSAIAE